MSTQRFCRFVISKARPRTHDKTWRCNHRVACLRLYASNCRIVWLASGGHSTIMARQNGRQHSHDHKHVFQIGGRASCITERSQLAPNNQQTAPSILPPKSSSQPPTSNSHQTADSSKQPTPNNAEMKRHHGAQHEASPRCPP